MNPNTLPSITVQDVAQKRANNETFILLDVREPHELQFAELGDGVETAPLSAIADEGVKALPDAVNHNKTAEIVVFCHHGGRSAQVTAWLLQQGWQNVYNMTGGIDAYAVDIDPTIGRY